jgi:hypothetical protein
LPKRINAASRGASSTRLLIRPLTNFLCIERGSFPEELVAKHLAAMGAPQARNVNTRVAEGSVLYKVLVGGAGQASGNAYLISEGVKRRVLLKIEDRSYRGEEWIFNGDKNQVTFTLPGQTRSQIGKFLFTRDMPQREG